MIIKHTLNPLSPFFHRESKTKNRISSRLASLSFLHDSEDDSEAPVISPLSRTHLSRSYTIDAPYFSSQPSEPSVKPEDSPASSPLPFQPSPPTSQQVADKAVASPTAATPASRSSVLSSTTPKAPSLQRSQAVDDPGTTREAQSTNTASIPSSAQKAPEPKPPLLGTQAKAEAPPLALHKEEPQLNSMQPKPPEFSWVSSSLPRSYQKSDSLRLTSVVTPRPFGTQSSRISSLPRAQTVSPADGSFILSLSELSKSLQLLGKLVNFLVVTKLFKVFCSFTCQSVSLFTSCLHPLTDG